MRRAAEGSTEGAKRRRYERQRTRSVAAHKVRSPQIIIYFQRTILISPKSYIPT